MKIKGDNDIHLVINHNHAPDPSILALSTFKKSLKQRSISGVTTLNMIYENEARQ